jgi:hypothetical protein
MKTYDHFPTSSEIPVDRPVLETTTSYLWMAEEDIYFSVPRPGAPEKTSDKEIKEDIRKFREFVGGRKVCLLIQSGPARSLPSKEQRELIQKELNALLIALAIITTSSLGQLTANIFFALKPAVYPVKMFTEVDEAIEWIKRVCKKVA